MKKFLAFILALAMLLTLATAVAAAEQDVTLTWAVFNTDNYTDEFWQHIIDAFEADNPGIKIEKVLMTGDSRPQFLKTMLAANNFPDINIDPVDLAKTDGVYAEVPAEMLANYEDAAIVAFNGKNTLIPAYKALRSQVYYNKALFAQAGIEKTPQTWEEFLAACEALKTAGITPLITAGASDIWATSFGYWVGMVNSEVYTKYPTFNQDVLAGSVSWTDQVFVDTLSNWQQLAQNGYYDKGSLSYSYTQASSEFLKGTAAMMLDGAWVAPSIDGGAVENSQDFGCFPIPVPSGAKTYCTMPQYWGVSATCKNVEAAFTFCQYVLGGNREIYEYYLKGDGVFSVTKDPIHYEMGPMQTAFVNNFADYALVPEITKMVGDNALPSGFEDYTLKSLQSIFAGADVAAELSAWDAEMARLKEQQ